MRVGIVAGNRDACSFEDLWLSLDEFWGQPTVSLPGQTHSQPPYLRLQADMRVALWLFLLFAEGLSEQVCKDSSDVTGSGLDERRFDVAARWADSFVSSGRLPGLTVAVMRDDSFFVHAAGVYNPDSIFRICSMTKAIVATAAASLIEDGLLPLGLETSVATILPELANPRVIEVCGAREPDAICPLADAGHRYRLVRRPMQITMPSSRNWNHRILWQVPAYRNITVEDLLTHRAGFTYAFFREHMDTTRWHASADVAASLMRKAGVLDGCHTDSNDATRGVDNEANVRRIAAIPLVSQPGTTYTYGLDTDVLGRVLEVVTGQSLEQVLQQRVLGPLGMNDTSFYIQPSDTARMRRLAELYHAPAGTLKSCKWEGAASWCSSAQTGYAASAQAKMQSGVRQLDREPRRGAAVVA